MDNVSQSDQYTDDGSSGSKSAGISVDDEEVVAMSMSSQNVETDLSTVQSEASSERRSDSSPNCQVHRSKSRVTQKLSPRRVTVPDNVLKPNEGFVRTRSGRVVKPVKRLLECMSMVISEPHQKDPLAELFSVLSSFMGN